MSKPVKRYQNIDQVAGGMAFRWSIRTKESECRAGERRWLERGAKRTLVRERRLKVSLAARAARSVRTAQMKKARSSERAYKKKNRHGFPCLHHVTWRRRGIQNRAARASPRRLKPPRDSLKTAHRAVFLARIDLIGSNPLVVVIKQSRHGYPCL